MYMMEISVMFLLTGCLIQGVFCDFTINLPEIVEALQGSCVIIPCTFDIDQQYENYLTDAKRMWSKGTWSKNIVFDSSSPDTGSLRGEIFGTPKEKNCTTRFDNVEQKDKGSYSFRLEANGGLKYTYPKTVEIVVIESPPKPTVSLLKDQEEVMKVTEGSSVNLRCSTKIFCSSRPAVLTWSSSPEHLLKESVTQQRQSETELISDLIFTVTHRHHSATFTCTVTHQLQQQIMKQESRMLRVQYAPKITSAHVNPSGFVLEGRSVTLSCSSDANPPVLNYTWYRDTEEHLKPVQTGQNLTINNTDPTHSGRYVCTAQNKHGAQNASVLLDVQFAPKISSSCNQSSVITCVCEAHGNPSPTLEWRLSGYVLANSTNMSISSETPGNTTLTSVLIIHQPLTETAVLQCFSANTHGTASASTRTSQQIHLVTPTPKTETRFHHPSLLLGAAVGALVVTILCIMKIGYERKRNPKPSEPRQDNRSGLILTQIATASNGDEECVYAVTHKPPESPHYSSIDFTNAEPASGEIRGASSLTDEYAVVRHRSAKDAASATDPKKDQSPPDSGAKITDVSSEDTIYENMTRRLVV